MLYGARKLHSYYFNVEACTFKYWLIIILHIYDLDHKFPSSWLRNTRDLINGISLAALSVIYAYSW